MKAAHYEKRMEELEDEIRILKNVISEYKTEQNSGDKFVWCKKCGAHDKESCFCIPFMTNALTSSAAYWMDAELNIKIAK